MGKSIDILQPFCILLKYFNPTDFFPTLRRAPFPILKGGVDDSYGLKIHILPSSWAASLAASVSSRWRSKDEPISVTQCRSHTIFSGIDNPVNEYPDPYVEITTFIQEGLSQIGPELPHQDINQLSHGLSGEFDLYFFILPQCLVHRS